jgi:hypothetical protein
VKGRVRWLVLAVVLVVVAGAVVARTASGGDEGSRTVALGPATDGVVAVPGFPARVIPATTVVAGKLFVFGGNLPRSNTFLNDGVLVARDFSTATHVPPAPFDPPLYNPRAVAVGPQVVVVGTACGPHPGDEDGAEPVCKPGTTVGAVLDTATMSWRAIDLPRRFRPQRSGGAAPLGATSDGRAVFQHGLGNATELWSFDPSHDTWAELAPAPVRVDRACMSGDTLVVQTAGYTNNGKILDDDPARLGQGASRYLGDGYVQPRIAGRDLTANAPWSIGPPGAGITYVTGSPAVICAGDHVMVHDGANLDVSLVYSLAARTWADPPAAPMRGYFGTSVWTGSEIVFVAPTSTSGPAPTMAYAPASNSWRVLEGMPRAERSLHWNGDAVVAYVEGLPQGPAARPGAAGVLRYVPTAD